MSLNWVLVEIFCEMCRLLNFVYFLFTFFSLLYHLGIRYNFILIFYVNIWYFSLVIVEIIHLFSFRKGFLTNCKIRIAPIQFYLDNYRSITEINAWYFFIWLIQVWIFCCAWTGNFPQYFALWIMDMHTKLFF